MKGEAGGANTGTFHFSPSVGPLPITLHSSLFTFHFSLFLALCYYLYVASPLTLSEVRSMLAPGLLAELIPAAEQRLLLQHHPDAQTGARLLHGACSCDLVRSRKPVSREDEAHLRERYRQLGLSRDDMIRSLDNHRRALEGRQRPEGHWPAAVSSFVAEHARNAGPTLYYLDFARQAQLTIPKSAVPLESVSIATVRAEPGSWLKEGRLTMAVRTV